MSNPQEMGEISAVWATTASMGIDDDEPTTTQLDSHANMVVAGGHATVFGKSGKSCNVRPFSSETLRFASRWARNTARREDPVLL